MRGTNAGWREKTLGIGSVKLHAHGEVIAIGTAANQHAALASPQPEIKQRADECKEEAGIDVARFAAVKVFHSAICDLLNGRTGTRTGTEMERLADSVGIKQGLRNCISDKVDRDDIEHRIRIARHGAPQSARIDFERPVHHLEAGSNAGARIAHNNTWTQNDARKRVEPRSD